MEIKNESAVLGRLNAKISGNPCPMCRSTMGFELQPLTFHQQSWPLDEPNLDFSHIQFLPCVAAICKNCGFVANFFIKE
jgi:hypothetical protein